MLSMPVDSATTQNPLDGLLGYQLRRAWLAMSTDLNRALDGLDLTLTEMSVLLLIEANPQITQSEIGRALSMQRANVAPIVATLAERELITREALDGRGRGLTLTTKGRTLARDARRRIAEHDKRFMARIPASDRPRVMRLLNEIWSA
jgi:DNA-binding MarR family transcriptional regulator